MLVVLAGGAGWTIAGHAVPLPGLWLRKHFPLFQLVRCPTRFNLFADVVAAVIAAGGLKQLLAGVSRPWARTGVLGVLSAGVVADLAMVPYFKCVLPDPPGCYAFMHRTAPRAAFVEVPQFDSGGSDLSALCAYWQSHHRGRTSAGYSGQNNVVFDDLVARTSPFLSELLARPDYLADPARMPLKAGGQAAFRDYAWLYLTVHDFRFVVVHQWPGALLPGVRIDRLKSALEPAKVYEDAGSVVYDRERLPRPRTAVMITTRGWRKGGGSGLAWLTDRRAHLLLYSSDDRIPLELTIDARSRHRVRHVGLVADGTELAHWDVPPRSFRRLVCDLRLARGLHELVLESDGTSPPGSRYNDADPRPASLRINHLELESAPALALVRSMP
jgi:hypothetical protein